MTNQYLRSYLIKNTPLGYGSHFSQVRFDETVAMSP